jgi:hypothetical protein
MFSVPSAVLPLAETSPFFNPRPTPIPRFASSDHRFAEKNDNWDRIAKPFTMLGIVSGTQKLL